MVALWLMLPFCSSLWAMLMLMLTLMLMLAHKLLLPVLMLDHKLPCLFA